MSGILARGAELVAALEAAGIRATLDPRNAHPPCVYVEPVSLDGPASRCAAAVTWHLLVLAGGQSNLDALTKLDELLPLVSTALLDGLAPTGQLVSHTSSTTGELLPAWQLTLSELTDWTAAAPAPAAATEG